MCIYFCANVRDCRWTMRLHFMHYSFTQISFDTGYDLDLKTSILFFYLDSLSCRKRASTIFLLRCTQDRIATSTSDATGIPSTGLEQLIVAFTFLLNTVSHTVLKYFIFPPCRRGGEQHVITGQCYWGNIWRESSRYF